jgi:hypothetical protein
MRCLKAFGGRIMARDPDRQAVEIQVRVALMSRFSAPGTAEIVRVARTKAERGRLGLSQSRATTPRLSRPSPDLCNDALGQGQPLGSATRARR